jgi:hypothetical protein
MLLLVIISVSFGAVDAAFEFKYSCRKPHYSGIMAVGNKNIPAALRSLIYSSHTHNLRLRKHDISGLRIFMVLFSSCKLQSACWASPDWSHSPAISEKSSKLTTQSPVTSASSEHSYSVRVIMPSSYDIHFWPGPKRLLM